jgi:hypothetical protein
MNFSEITNELKKGNKIRRSCWQEGHYWVLSNDESKHRLLVNSIGKVPEINRNQLEATDWEIFKDKVEIAKNKQVKDRTQEEHLILIKELYKGNVRDYFLSMGEFKDIPIENTDKYIYSHIIAEKFNVLGIVPIKRNYNIPDEFKLDLIADWEIKYEWYWKVVNDENIKIIGLNKEKIKVENSIFSYEFFNRACKTSKEFGYEETPEIYLPYNIKSKEYIKNQPCLIIFERKLVFILAPRIESE